MALRCASEGQYSDAEELLRRALAAPLPPPAWYGDLAVVCEAAGRMEEAARFYREFATLAPGCARAHTGLGGALCRIGMAEDAEVSFGEALKLNPADRRAAAGLGTLLAKQHRFEEAVDVLERSLAAGDCREAHFLLASIYQKCEAYPAAARHFRQAVNLGRADAEAVAGLIRANWGLGELQQTLEWSQLLIARGDASEALHAFYNYILLYSPATTPALIRQEAARFGERFRVSAPQVFHPTRRRRKDRKLRIGYLTGEFMKGAAFFFLSPIIAHHDRDRFDVFAYHTRSVFDEATEWYRKQTLFRDCRQLDDPAIEALVRGDEIDVLVDLSGFFPDRRLCIFARRAAPVQILYPNCPTTSGVSEIDHILTDRWTCPPGMEWQYTENPLFLPSGYLAYRPPAQAASPVPSPVSENGFVTFGFFQRRAKMNAPLWDAIAAILRRCPGSRMVLQNCDHTLDNAEESYTRRVLEREFVQRGVDLSCVRILGERTQAEVMRLMSQVDIALDSFPYQGQTTTCECLYMGVPVIALSGMHHVARVGSALLRRAGLAELVADSVDEYCRVAIALASAPERLREFRATLRDRFVRSPVSDGVRLAREIEQAYTSAWENWQRGMERT